MTNLINLHTARHARLQARAKGATLCSSGFHKWQAEKEGRFEVKQGKLLTAEHCLRCTRKEYTNGRQSTSNLPLGGIDAAGYPAAAHQPTRCKKTRMRRT